MLILLLLPLLGEPDIAPSRLAHTYSIVAHDPAGKEIGGAVQSHWFSVGSGVLWAEPGIGVVATQSFTRRAYGPLGLEAMAKGEAPAEALKRLTAEDDGRDVRQVAMIDARGRAAGFTGKGCIDHACDRRGPHFSVQANIMLEPGVCAAMAKAFEETKSSLADRMMAALEAAEAIGGDLRGRQSAAMVVVTSEKPDHPWEGRVLDLRVEDHPEPLVELRRLIGVHTAYGYMSKGDEALEAGDVAAGLAAYSKATSLLPDRVEPMFWRAFTLVSVGRVEEALPLFERVFAARPEWREMPRRLVRAGLLADDPALLERIESR